MRALNAVYKYTNTRHCISTNLFSVFLLSRSQFTANYSVLNSDVCATANVLGCLYCYKSCSSQMELKFSNTVFIWAKIQWILLQPLLNPYPVYNYGFVLIEKICGQRFDLGTHSYLCFSKFQPNNFFFKQLPRARTVSN